jgi:biotin carboxyl carrier protein
MRFEVEVNGRARTVVVERTGGGRGGSLFAVTVDGRTRAVDVRRAGRSGFSLILPEDGHASHDVTLGETARTGEWIVQLPAGTLRAVVDGRRVSAAAGSLAGAEDGEQRVVAPMPGRVVRVLVAPGDEVAARQGLVVIEAMKMENELGSPKAGRVKDVQVSAGQSVEAGRVLVVVE